MEEGGGGGMTTLGTPGMSMTGGRAGAGGCTSSNNDESTGSAERRDPKRKCWMMGNLFRT